ncbi:MAG: glutaconyl-CoA/methylmalonyl-CoA decarboxylase subunit gamma [Bacillota bacterium]|nr:glutaconyl-CoA/methylmalonyl-CoA decarboxylase subunit gamma [Bacillota bacterium]
MRKFRVTVNGETYEVEVEETGVPSVAAPAAQVAAPAAAPQTTPASPSKPAAPAAKPAPKPAAGAGSVKAPMPGNILSVKVKPGDQVKSGQVLLTLEAMKMENEIMAPRDGTVKNVFVNPGQSVNTGDVLVDLE